jgi:hypothetical protein
MLPEALPEHTIVVLYDLRESWEEAAADRERWGREHTDIYPMGLDHVLLVFRPGGDTAEAAA